MSHLSSKLHCQGPQGSPEDLHGWNQPARPPVPVECGSSASQMFDLRRARHRRNSVLHSWRLGQVERSHYSGGRCKPSRGIP